MNMYNILGVMKDLTNTKDTPKPTAKETVYESVEPRGSIMEAISSLEEQYTDFKKAVNKADDDLTDIDNYKFSSRDTDTAVAPSQAKTSAADRRKRLQDLEDRRAEKDDWFSGKDKVSNVRTHYAKHQDEPEELDEYTDDESELDSRELSDRTREAIKAHDDATAELGMFTGSETGFGPLHAAKKRARMAANADELDEVAPPGAKAERMVKHIKKGYAADGELTKREKGIAYATAWKAKKAGQLNESTFHDIPNKEGIVIMGAGGDPSEWIDGIFNMWKEEGIAGGNSAADAFDGQLVLTTTGGRTDLVLPFKDGADLNIGKMAMWRLRFGDCSWISDYKDNYAEQHGFERPGQDDDDRLEEGVEFKDTIKNSAAKMTKAKPAKLKEARVMEDTDYFYEQVGKALAEKSPTLDTAGSEFADAVRKEMVAQGIAPNRARNILTMDEDFLGDVATSYAHYCQEIAECSAPVNTFNSAQELDEIAALAGLPRTAPSEITETFGVMVNGKEVNTGSIEVEGVNSWDRPDFADAYITYAEFSDGTPLDDDELIELENEHGDLVNQAAHDSLEGAGDFMEEKTVGNEFTQAMDLAMEADEKEFEVAGEKYTVKEDINISVNANGEEDAVNLIRKLAGMPVIAVAAQQVEAEPVIDMTGDVEIDEERDIEYANTPDEQTAPVSAAIPSGTDLHRAKKSYSDKPYRGDNPMAESKEAALWKQYESLIGDVKE